MTLYLYMYTYTLLTVPFFFLENVLVQEKLIQKKRVKHPNIDPRTNNITV